MTQDAMLDKALIVDLTIDDGDSDGEGKDVENIKSSGSSEGARLVGHRLPGMSEITRAGPLKRSTEDAPDGPRRRRKLLQSGIVQEHEVLHHRLTFTPPSSPDGTLLLDHLPDQSVLDDFVIFHYLPARARHKLCSLRVFEPSTSVPLEVRAEFSSYRRELRAGVRAYDMLKSLNQKGRRAKDGEGRPCMMSVKGIRVQAGATNICSVGVVAKGGKFVYLGRPSALYADIYHAYWVVPQLIASLPKRCRRQPDLGRSGSVRALSAALGSPEGNRGSNHTVAERCTRGLVGIKDFSNHYEHIRRVLPYYTTMLLKTMPLSPDPLGTTQFELLDHLQVLMTRIDRPSPADAAAVPDPTSAPVTQPMVFRSLETGSKLKWAPCGSPLREEAGGCRNRHTGREETGVRVFWRKVRLSGVTIQVDDTVMVKCRDTGGEHLQQGLVRWFTETRFTDCRLGNEQHCHVHWMRSSACGEADERLLEHGVCSDIPLKHIRAVSASAPTPTRHVYERSYNTWRTANLHDERGSPICDSCRVKVAQAEHRLRLKGDGGFQLNGERYHPMELVLLDTGVVGDTWQVAQVVGSVHRRAQLKSRSGSASAGDVRNFEVRVKPFERFSALAKKCGYLGYTCSRRIIATDEEEFVTLDRIVSKAFFGEDDSTTSAHPSFSCTERFQQGCATRTFKDVVPLQHPMSRCQTCHSSFAEQEADYNTFRNRHQPPSADYYAGGGGGIIGGQRFFNCGHAVEMDGIACDTLQTNHPAMIVHSSKVCDISLATRRMEAGHLVDVFDERDRNQPIHLRARVPLLPCPGSIMLVMAGPPCQGHSGANHHNGFQDTRNDELFVMLWEVERLKPDFFILENVPGMKRDKVDKDILDSEGARNYAVDAIRHLRQIGYQCRLALLDSRSYGSPQNRVRLFILSAWNGVPLPTFPEPTHSNPAIRITLFSIEDKEDNQQDRGFFVGSKGTQGSGAYTAVTAGEAISDLPAFEFAKSVSPMQPQAHRTRRDLPTFDAIRGHAGSATMVGFDKPTTYAMPATNDYQKMKRSGERTVQDHYTSPRTRGELDIIFSSPPMVGDPADTGTHGSRRRLNPDRGAMTLLTSSAPGGKYTGGIHPTQHRTLTVAERKRLQGVPDSYRLAGIAIEQDRQVGNMINVEVSRAIHAHIHRTILYPAWVEMGRPEDFMASWRARYPLG